MSGTRAGVADGYEHVSAPSAEALAERTAMAIPVQFDDGLHHGWRLHG